MSTEFQRLIAKYEGRDQTDDHIMNHFRYYYCVLARGLARNHISLDDIRDMIALAEVDRPRLILSDGKGDGIEDSRKL